MGRISSFKVELSIAAVVIVLDQIVKAVIRSGFELHDSVEVIPGFFNLTRVHNTGAAFGMPRTAANDRRAARAWRGRRKNSEPPRSPGPRAGA